MHTREGSFGSSHLVFWVEEGKKNRPFKEITINGEVSKGLLNTGADVSCIAGNVWPANWPTASSLFSGCSMHSHFVLGGTRDSED